MAEREGAGIDPTGLRDTNFVDINPATKEKQQEIIDALTSFSISEHDGGSVSYPTPTQEVYTFTLNSVTVQTVTLNYTDSTKYRLSSWSKT